ncbi:MAG: dTDP-4-dehydrorhamnose 3,5-epimerase [Phycisphaerales bacterium]
MQFLETDLPGVFIVEPVRHGDHRGFFAETWNAERFTAAGLDRPWMQDNHSRSQTPGTLRGLHFQAPPHAQTKLVRVIRGSVLDVAVDIRRGSPTFGKHVAVELSESNFRQLYVPAGFAHGFVTQVPDTEVLYKVDAGYAPDADMGIAWDDADLGIDWGASPDAVVLSDKDQQHPTLAGLMDALDREGRTLFTAE